MTFDMKAARQLCGPEMAIKRFRGTYCGCPVVEDSFFFGEDQFSSFTIKNDPALSERLGKLHDVFTKALDKIDAQAKRIAELEAVLSQAQRVIVESQKAEKQLRERIAELEGNVKRQSEIIKLERIEFTNRYHKQRAALKKLGQAKRERGKTLVEEQANQIAGIPISHLKDRNEQERYRSEARQQLRQEKLL
jgi:hypothetical protein